MIVKINGIPITTNFHQIDGVHLIPHQGIDIAVSMNTPIHSVDNGFVHVVNEGNKSFGLSVHEHLNNGDDVIYGHLNKSNVYDNQFVHQGDVVGYSGNTGHSTGAHLHLQVMHHGVAVDPISYVANAVTPATNYPWWDLSDRIKTSVQQGIEHGLLAFSTDVLHGLDVALGVLLPTLACIGIVMWMIPFFPKSDTGPKITGTSMLLYMFYSLLKASGYL